MGITSGLKKFGNYLITNESEASKSLPDEFLDKSIDVTRGEPAKRDGRWQKIFAFIYVFDWYPSHYSKFEKWHVFKVDIAVTLFCALSFFTKYLDQMNLTNAYVTGMKEDLNLNGNELNIFSTFYNIGYCVGQIPAMFFITKKGWARWLLIVCESIWGICTFANAAVHTAEHIYVIRFFVGLSEAASFPGQYYIISSWYTPEELSRRAGFYNFCSGVGTMVAGYIQSGAHSSLNGRNGLEGWRWQFIIDGLITAVVTIYGIIVFPGTPNHIEKHAILGHDDLVFARRRLKEHKVVQSKSWDAATFKKIIFSWEFILLPFLWIVHHQITYSSAFSLYLKSEGYSVADRNNIPTVSAAIGSVSMLLVPTLCDVYGRFNITMVCFIIEYFSNIILIVWNVPQGLKFVGFFLSTVWYGLAPSWYSWAAIICKDSAEKKGLILALMHSYSYATQAWTIPLQWNLKHSPRFLMGWSINLGFVFIGQILFYVIFYLAKKQHKSDLRYELDVSDKSSDELSVDDEIVKTELTLGEKNLVK
ncbi:liz1 [Cyberlindnera jadinii]|uniref:Liz1 protein n=1 Tax=Cyberlindnera jadinii (strain ATCC 18201 / CBS 1600 / BCRC 20928 / JCM 3617 / NBRC 0987 / NRRL Y-1542) TaxID=983966 RepID=A0A0H5CKY2_CYBJN|nr:MFS general substrate transporter [Cyberlindnera jadinii NRRL Y-1542]ODV73813.1 MFS general substrate transporter [Cyberlindnera jadinii NRRL Y-1542]CEP25144.1 liz1 [Cyberlindnera jadinii]